jgi:hypothetical protein
VLQTRNAQENALCYNDPQYQVVEQMRNTQDHARRRTDPQYRALEQV